MGKNRGRITLEKEAEVLTRMVQISCRGQHGEAVLCPDCAQLLAYGLERLRDCPKGADKGFCSSCTIHCYAPDMGERMRGVMRYAGPRMLVRHPGMALRHAADRLRCKRFSRTLKER